LSSKAPKERNKKLEVRQATAKDVRGIVALVDRAYERISGYSSGMIRGQINNYPEGQFVALYEGKIVGYCASMRLDERLALAPHSWDEITNDGFGSRHDPTGDWLYGYEMCVDPGPSRSPHRASGSTTSARRLQSGWSSRAWCSAGRMPGLSPGQAQGRNARSLYRAGPAAEDPRPDHRLPDQERLRADRRPQELSAGGPQSLGFAAHMVWRNPYVDPSEPPKFRVPRDVESVRVATCQFQARAVANFEEFVGNVEYFVEVAADYRADFVVFPELFTLQLLAFEKAKLTPMEAIDRLTDHTPNLTAELSRMALRYNINIIGGSHPTRTDDGDIQNVAIVCLRDGSVHLQEKIHPTPNERYWWKIKGGDRIDAIQTDCGRSACSSAMTASFRSSRGGWWTKGRGSSSSPSAPTVGRAICESAIAARPERSRTNAMSSSPAMSAICPTSRIWTSNTPRAASSRPATSPSPATA
jgi:hypothetical protein